MATPQGINVRYTIRHAEIRDALRQLQQRGERLKPVFMAIGEKLLESTQKRFTSKLDPDGRPWSRQVSDDYAERKRNRKATSSPGDARTTDPADVNFLTGRLRDNLAYKASDSDLLVGSAEAYAGVRNHDRQFLGLSDEDRTTVRELLEDHLTRR